MRFVWAVVAFVLAAVMIGTGIAQRTVLQGPTTVDQPIHVAADVPYVMIDGAVLNSHDGPQTLRVVGPGTIFAAYARTDDLSAWLQKADYAHLTLGNDGAIVAETVVRTEGGADAAVALSPIDSDLWLEQFQQDNVLDTRLQLPEDMSVLVASDGTRAAPGDLTLSWPTGATTPWAGPLIVGGSLLLVAGLVLYYLGVRHARRSRGPRRKGLPVPVTEPIDLAIEAGDKGVISATPTRRSLTRGKRSFVILPVVTVSALMFAGCSPDAWPQLAGSPTPSATPSIIVPDDQGSPAVTEAQADRIVSRIAAQVAIADEANDAAAAAVRLDGAALKVRETNYRLRTAIADQNSLDPIPSSGIRVLLPEAFDGWPRSFFAVVGGGADSPDKILSVTQADAWSDYKVTYMADLAADTSLNLAPSYVGAISIDPDSPFLLLAPSQLAAAYADVLDKDRDSEFAPLFDVDTDAFRTQVAANRASRLDSFNQTAAETGTLSFAASAGDTAPVALATLDSGAIVAVEVNETDTVTPTSTDAVIKLDDSPTVKALAGVSQSGTGFTTTYVDQLFFFVPAQSSEQRIQFLGYSSSILDVKAVTP
ncbi:glycosyl transferase [Microbacterium sp.]|uniref:glycosyl transferase n=1 Tax=Microbacterium sp. TaxID=51671 RepID=UPI0025CED715|nr:glycosyl transferase [Microbacterium sp.]